MVFVISVAFSESKSFQSTLLLHNENITSLNYILFGKLSRLMQMQYLQIR
nr:MAG TPA: hypothetical protein [Caudoviricetes sp.]